MTAPKHLPPHSRVAVVGSGVAGLTAAHLLARTHTVTLLESDSRLGGHAHTQTVSLLDGDVSVDTGFIVHNDRTYPTLLTLFAELGIATQDTDMSMSVRSELTGLEYAGARGALGLFPHPRNAVSPRHIRMLIEVRRFHRLAHEVLTNPGNDVALDEFVREAGLSDYFLDNFLLPLVAAVWSCDSATAGRYPARYLFEFLDHHGMLTVFGSPTWRTVTGGSATYVQAVADRLASAGGRVLVDAPVRGIRETEDGVRIEAPGLNQTFDAVVVATHPHQALAALDGPTGMQREVLGDIAYLPKHAVLHTDTSLLPRSPRARASWNYQIRGDGDDVAVTYDLTRLMRLSTGGERVLVTMGRTDLVHPQHIVSAMTYEHPVYDLASVSAQKRLPDIDTARIVFAGAYHGWGFHEDGAASGARAAERLGNGRLGNGWSTVSNREALDGDGLIGRAR
ncbi:NAD(P)/FAD-dependent oxidoreductase [Gordonia liuliyuniae]|uniref:FAD-dependent oxidoreductase n=1 Tax=Gordonia liuliyuniae TaxID=2911517 RepID=A0ABS9IW64_9ACTN|nr:FAD-dependent oxidoreductase [Gordonia liuliyuniae]MCF8589766.1 FAD-dependent oxidoreductase [Gordonia liuliyuniae]